MVGVYIIRKSYKNHNIANILNSGPFDYRIRMIHKACLHSLNGGDNNRGINSKWHKLKHTMPNGVGLEELKSNIWK